MKTIIAILMSLSEEEQANFLLWLKQKNRRGDTKNIKLVQLLQQGKHNDVALKLYGKSARNSFHALCKRVQDSLIDFLATKAFAGETSEEHEILKLLLASRILFEQKQYKIAHKTLLKAENKAQELDLYAILNEIYHTKIQYAHTAAHINLSHIMVDAQKNMELYQYEFQINTVFASIKVQLKENPTKKDLNSIIENAFKTLHNSAEQHLTFKSLYQLINSTTSAAKLQSDYHAISPFMLDAYNRLSQKEALAQKQRFYHIKVLDLMAISSFRNKEFIDSIRFTKTMEEEMNKGNRKYYKRFFKKLILIKSLNLNYTGKPTMAMALLHPYTESTLNIQLIYLMYHFQQHKFTEAYQLHKQFMHSDLWYEKKEGWIWVLKKNMLEILLLIELDKLDLVLIRLQTFKRKFTTPLKKIKEERVLVFVRLVEQYYENPNEVTTEEFKNKVQGSFDWLGREREDIFVMSFYAWLKAKMETKNLYETTLELVSKS